MNDQIHEIAQRLRGLRDILNITEEELAKVCNISTKEYIIYENGETDIPISALENISKKYKVDLTALLFGDEPKTRVFYLNRAGQGTAMERTKAYKYEDLASGFIDRKADPFIVTVEPIDEKTPMHLNSHEGQEFHYVLNGKLLLSIDGHQLTLNEGDSIYFDASRKHGIKALDGKPVKFLAIIF
jgi:transcriptional regulator with XRE-family HTH domain